MEEYAEPKPKQVSYTGPDLDPNTLNSWEREKVDLWWKLQREKTRKKFKFLYYDEKV